MKNSKELTQTILKLQSQLSDILDEVTENELKGDSGELIIVDDDSECEDDDSETDPDQTITLKTFELNTIIEMVANATTERIMESIKETEFDDSVVEISLEYGSRELVTEIDSDQIVNDIESNLDFDIKEIEEEINEYINKIKAVNR